MRLSTPHGKTKNLLTNETEQLVLKLIRETNPEWVEQDGGCPKCASFYFDLDNVVQLRKGV